MLRSAATFLPLDALVTGSSKLLKASPEHALELLGLRDVFDRSNPNPQESQTHITRARERETG